LSALQHHPIPTPDDCQRSDSTIIVIVGGACKAIFQLSLHASTIPNQINAKGFFPLTHPLARWQ